MGGLRFEVVEDWRGVSVCKGEGRGGEGRGFDEPTAHHMTSGSNIEKHANTRLRIGPHILPSAEREKDVR